MQTQKLSRGLMQIRKKMAVGGAAQTKTAFQNLPTIAKSQWSKLILINQQTTSLQVPTVIATKGEVLNQYSKHTNNLMCLMALGTLKGTFSLQLKTQQER